MLIESRVLGWFAECLTGTLSAMAGLEVEPGTPFQKTAGQSSGDISSVIGFGGSNLTGCLVMHFPRTAALVIYEGMMGENPGELNDEVRDGIGELANIVLGSAKTAFSRENIDFQLSIPTIVVGEGHRVRLHSSLPVMIIPFAVAGEACSLEVAIKFGAN
jgi:chemotaxis protein CheX